MLVDKLIDKYGLMQQAALQAIGLARSTYCYKSKAAGRALTPLDAEFSQAIREVVKRASVYGYRKVHAVLRARGWWGRSGVKSLHATCDLYFLLMPIAM